MKRAISFVLCLFMVLGMTAPFSAHAQEAGEKVVRVGWYESTYCYVDSFGRRRGIAYEYQQKIAAYTGWTYEYVEDSWPNLFQMLIDGEIDLLSDVSHTEEREDWMLFSTLPMGEESYYVYIDAENTSINSDDLTSFNGKRIGVNKDSFQEGLLKAWADKNGLTPVIMGLAGKESDSMGKVAAGEIDAYVTMDSLGAVERMLPVCKIGASEYYFTVNRDRPDLLNELNAAMRSIQEENPYFNQRMMDDYIHIVKTDSFLAPGLESWLSGHGPIRVGYMDDELPFCASDKSTGGVTGALRDFLAHASNCLKNADVHFKAVPFSSMHAALEAMKNGEIDAVFPVNLSSYDGEVMGLLTVAPVMQTKMSLMMRSENQPEIVQGKSLTIAVTADNANYETFIKDYLSSAAVKAYPTVADCFKAVADREADGALVCDYRTSVTHALAGRYKLVPIPTGEMMTLSFAVRRNERELYSVLDKIANLTPVEDMEYALLANLYSDRRVSLMEYLEDNWIAVMVFVTAIFALILFLLAQKLQAEHKANEQQRQLEEAAGIRELKDIISSLLDNMPGMTFTKDAETGAYLACNQAFAESANKESPQEVIGMTDAQLFDAETAAHFEADDRMALSMDKPFIFYEYVPDAAGNKRQFQTTKIKYTDTAGRLCVLGMRQDVTDMVRIRHENAMTKESYEKTRDTGIMYSHIAQTLTRDYTDMFYVNADTEAFIEYRRDHKNSVLSETRRGWHFFSDCRKELSQSVYPDDRDAFLKAMKRRTLMKVLERKSTFVMTYRVTGDNGPTYVSMKVSLMEDDERFIIVGITDVDAEIREAMAKSKALADALTSAEKANKATTSFLSSLSHEVRTPMNAIVGLGTLALRDENLGGQTREYIQKIEESSRHLLGLISDILDLSRIETGYVVLRRERFSFRAMLDQIKTEALSQCGDKGISFECRLLNQVDDYYIGDEAKLKEALSNILSNAVQSTEATGSITLTVERPAEPAEDKSTLRFCIRDTGAGMDQESIPRIFDAFSQEDESRMDAYGSTGLGMAIAKKIVELMDGSISVGSEKGVGTEFTVTVTLRNCDQEETDQDGSVDPHELHVLVVDDDQIAAEYAQTVLDEIGIRADICTSGEEALHMLETQRAVQEPYNLVLMDWNMPGMDGLEVSEEIRKQYDNETTVIVLTAFNWTDIQEEAHRAGVDSFLTKPLTAAQVLEEFERIARRNKMGLRREKKRAPLAGRRILLAEDVEINAEIMKKLLETEHMQTDHAANGRIAVEMFQNSEIGTYAAILMDVRMPEMDGLEAATAIRALDREDAERIPIIALTANVFEEDVQQTIQAGMNAHLTKPVVAEQLFRMLGEQIYEAEEHQD